MRQLGAAVEPGAVEVWIASHAAASGEELPSVSTTNGAISNSSLSVAPPVPGTATPRACLRVTGEVHDVTPADPRLVSALVLAAVTRLTRHTLWGLAAGTVCYLLLIALAK